MAYKLQLYVADKYEYRNLLANNLLFYTLIVGIGVVTVKWILAARQAGRNRAKEILAYKH